MTMTYDEARSAITENEKRAPHNSEWLHEKSGHVYAVLSHAIIEATMEPAVVYYRRDGWRLVTWCRPASANIANAFCGGDNP